MAENSKVITLHLDPKPFEDALKAALEKIPKQATIQLNGVVAGAPGAAAPVAMGGQPITGAAGYTIQPGVIPGAPEGLTEAAGRKAKMLEFASALKAATAAAVAMQERLTEAVRIQGAVDRERLRTARMELGAELRDASGEKALERAEELAKRRSAIRLGEKEVLRGWKDEDDKRRKAEREAAQSESRGRSAQASERLVAFERARMLATGIPGLVNPLLGTQMSGVMQAGSHAIGMYSQWQALSERHQIRMSRYGRNAAAAGGSGGGGVDGQGATADAAAAAAPSVGSALTGMITRSIAQVALNAASLSMDIAQQASNKMGSLQLQRAGIRYLAGSHFGTGTEADVVSRNAASLGIGPDEMVAADARLARSAGKYAGYAREFAPGIMATGGSVESLAAVAKSLAVSQQRTTPNWATDQKSMDALSILAATTASYGGERGDAARSGFAQTMLEMSQRGIQRDPVELAIFQQKMTPMVGLERATATTQQYGGYQNPVLGNIRGALRQYSDMLQMAHTMKGAKSLEDVFANDEKMTAQQRLDIDKSGGTLALLGRGFSTSEAESLLKTPERRFVDRLSGDQTAKGAQDEERRAAAIGAQTELAQMSIVEGNTAKIAEAQTKFITSLTSVGDALNSMAAKMRNWVPAGVAN